MAGLLAAPPGFGAARVGSPNAQRYRSSRRPRRPPLGGLLRSTEGSSPDEKREAEAPRLAVLVLQPCGLDVVAGGLSGAPPSEKGPIGLGCGATFLRAIRDSRF